MWGVFKVVAYPRHKVATCCIPKGKGAVAYYVYFCMHSGDGLQREGYMSATAAQRGGEGKGERGQRHSCARVAVSCQRLLRYPIGRRGGQVYGSAAFRPSAEARTSASQRALASASAVAPVSIKNASLMNWVHAPCAGVATVSPPCCACAIRASRWQWTPGAVASQLVGE